MVRGALLEQVFLFVAGTRPEAVKLSPVILALRAQDRPAYLVATGQHRELFHEALAGFGLVADDDLAIMQRAQAPAAVVGALVPALAAICERLRPAAVIVQGDTATAFAGAQAAVYARRPLVHVEAGLRSGHFEPFPEEMHRRAIAQLADLHFAPTAAARAALLKEGVAADTIHVTGNTGIDALRLVEARLVSDAVLGAMLAQRFAGIDFRRPVIVATVHRRENHGARLAQVLAALAELAGEAEIVVPVHPHPAVSGPVHAILGGRAGVHLLPPLDYAAFIWLLQRATLALTDSGGVQEEAPALGVPVLVLRDVTERREGLDSGNARLMGTDAGGIIDTVRGLLADRDSMGRMSEAALPYGVGNASGQIVDVMLQRFCAATRASGLPDDSLAA
jgi:UDP-N-acetylglucosamine 2-epimerase (non-hydrolysing)